MVLKSYAEARKRQFMLERGAGCRDGIFIYEGGFKGNGNVLHLMVTAVKLASF